MNNKIYKNRKSILVISIILFTIGLLIAYYNWGTEPNETIGGVFCGLGLGISLISFSLKKPIE
jgi:hypothetical protein